MEVLETFKGIDKKAILNDFSVVIQGKIFGLPGDPYEKQLTLQCIESIRQYMPDAEIILSTWKGSDVSHLLVDKVVFNDDPGAIAISIYEPAFFNNNNRQIVSTYNGLKAATKKYAIKMRGDCKLSSTAFLDFFKEYPRSPKYRFFKQRVIIPTKYSRNPRRITQLNHASDIFQVGLTEDLLNLWDIPLQPEPDTTRAIPVEKRIINGSLIGAHFRLRYGPEQYIWYAFTKKMGLDLELRYYSDLPVSKILNSDFSIINNFIIAEGEQIGVVMPKRMTVVFDKDLYTHKEWMSLNNKYSLKGATRWDELVLIAQVYGNNIKWVIIKVIKLVTYRIKAFVKKLFGITDKTLSESEASGGLAPNHNI